MNFRSKHNLKFEAATWWRDRAIKVFRVGTCHGQWFDSATAYRILSVTNEKPGNGHLEDVFEWFENSCKRDRRSLIIMEFFNEKFKEHCIKKRGFMPVNGTDHLIKIFNYEKEHRHPG